MRTATRRLRGALRTFGPIVRAEWSLPLEHERQVAGRKSLGPCEISMCSASGLLKASGDTPETLAPLFRTLAVEHERASGRLKEVLEGERWL